MENPQGGLEKMYYMSDWEDKKKIIELCAYLWPFKKTTNLWTSGINWQPQGVTGNGRCGEKCGQGSANPLTQRFKHFMALAVDPQRGPRGSQAAQMTCGMPTRLITEILSAVAEMVPLQGKAVVDLCAGFQSMREAVLATGATYVAVDVEGKRVSKGQHTRRCAIALCHDGRVLAVEQRMQDGTHCWTIPGGQQQSNDHSAQHTALRELREDTGLGKEVLQDTVRVGPELIALSETTYLAYALNSIPSKVRLLESFAQRRDSRRIRRIQWVDQPTARHMQWRPEDRLMLQRLWGPPQHICMETGGRGGC